TGNPCSESASGTLLDSSGSASITMSDGSVHSNLQATNSVVAETAGSVTSTIAASIPGAFVPFLGSSGTVGGITYNLQTLKLELFDTAKVTVTNPSQANDAKAIFQISTTITDVFNQTL